MPRTTAPRLRHEIIDECLRNRLQQWSLNKLKGKVNEYLRDRYGLQGVAARTIDKDLKAMKAIYGAPIVSRREEKHVWYNYSEDFSLMHLPLEEADLLKLNEAVHLLNQIKGFTIAEEIEKVVRKLEKKVKIEGDAPAIIAFENSPPADGIENLQDLFLAIKQKKVLKIGYGSFKANTPQEIAVHPYFLKEYNNRWFLVVLNNQRKT